MNHGATNMGEMRRFSQGWLPTREIPPARQFSVRMGKGDSLCSG
ncbi:hypothetical protein THTE_4124 [Thermogutta terrifontis]|uniref:Uncharacterized protein n=1 Tax=Thermogutta terrifontis TaxID=1331910 RepID=A0A286RL70_9BACT|nr:hypothetical protein THTE_4124 [Thermogutta terrifontis]